MDSTQQIQGWNAVFFMEKGRVICSDCMSFQDLQEAEQLFKHSTTCRYQNVGLARPWQALHDILDNARG